MAAGAVAAGGFLGLNGHVAGHTVKGAAALGLADLEAFRNAINPKIPRIFILCRKVGFACPSTIETP
jgi:hypothetical protein